MSTDEKPDIQIIANLVVVNQDGEVLLTQYNPAVDRWWLPGQDVAPYTHPDETAQAIVESMGVQASSTDFRRVQSFRGRRGWHLAFDYLVRATGSPNEPAQWFDVASLPPTMHGDWERAVLGDLLAA